MRTFLVLGALGLPALANGQAGTYAKGTSTTPFVAFSDGTPAGVTGQLTGARFTLGFQFAFYGTKYGDVYANSLGQVLLPGSNASLVGHTAFTPIPGTAAPNGWVSPWWAYTSGGTPPWQSMNLPQSDSLRFKVTGPPGNRIAHVQWSGWQYYSFGSTGCARDVQVRLYEATRAIEFHYGPKGAGSCDFYATSGIEDPTGGLGDYALVCQCTITPPPTCTPNCSGSSHWPAAGTLVRFDYATTTADLYAVPEVTSITPTAIAGNPALTIATKTTFFNLGKTATGNFAYDLYVSGDAVIDTTDTQVASGSVAGGGVVAQSNAVVNDTFTVLKPAGVFHVGVIADPPTAGKPAGDVIEADENNNSGATEAIPAGYDLEALSIAGPIKASLGDTASVTVKFRNRGTDPVAPISYGVYLSDDAVIDPRFDSKVGTFTASVNGFETITAAQNVTLAPSLIRGGIPTFTWGLYVDPADLLTGEASEANNAVAGGKIDILLPDLRIDNPRVIGTEIYLGEPIQAAADLFNDGDGNATNVTVGIYLSENATITINDWWMGELTGINLNAKSSTLVTVSGRVPTTRPDTTPLLSGNYYVGVIVDPDRVIPETNEANNARPTPPVFLREPVPDFVVANVVGPSAAALGEVVPVTRTLRNIGNRGNDTAGPAVRYQYFLSSNSVVTAADRRLKIVEAGADVDDRELRLAAGESAPGTDYVRVPFDVQPGGWYLGVLVDTAGAVAELREDNNGGATAAPVNLEPGSLQITTAWLADATVQLPYAWQLAARGGTGAYTWAALEDTPATSPLPKGVWLDPATGVVSGAPEAEGQSWFVAEVTSGNQVARTRLALRVLAPSTALQMSTQSLPTATENLGYIAPLVAVGGVRPYTWNVIPGTPPSGVLPLSLTLGRDVLTGLMAITGSPRTGTAGSYTITLRVADSTGAAVSRSVPLKVAKPGSLVITSESYIEAVAGSAFSQTVNATGSVAFPYRFAIDGGALPPGLEFTDNGREGLLSGTPAAPGVYGFGVRVVDANNQVDRADFVMAVKSSALFVNQTALPPGRPGQSYDAQLTSTTKRPRPTWRVVSGDLPPAVCPEAATPPCTLKLATVGGAISGVIDASAGGLVYDFVVEVSDDSGGQGVGALAIAVAPVESRTNPPGGGCRCGVLGGAPSVTVLFAIALGAAGRRHPRGRQARGSAPAGPRHAHRG